MRRVSVGAAIALLLTGLGTEGFAAQRSPIPISVCENITQPGNYVLTNNLVLDTSDLNYDDYGQGGNCLVISSSHVNLNLNGWTITIACPPLSFSYCPSATGVPGGIGIEVTSGADQVSIANGIVDGFVYGIVVEKADHLSVSNLGLRSVVGLTLEDASHSTLTSISYAGGDTSYHGSNGPALYVEGGSHNNVSNLSGFDLGRDLGSGPNGIAIVNSNYNSISDVSIEDTSCDDAAVLLSSDSSFNIISNSTLFDECGGGIEIDLGGQHNTISGNSVIIASPPDVFAAFDQNSNCGSNVWTGNSFTNIFSVGQISASPANCAK